MVPKPKYDKNLRKIVPITCGYWEANKEFRGQYLITYNLLMCNIVRFDHSFD